MRVLLLTDELYKYLQYVVATHTGSGITPQECGDAHQLWSHINEAQTVDVSNLGKAKVDAAGPDGVSMTLEPEEPEGADRLADVDPEISGRG